MRDPIRELGELTADPTRRAAIMRMADRLDSDPEAHALRVRIERRQAAWAIGAKARRTSTASPSPT